tara:strand:+ start:6902 stop:7102 length:201 start_codon:yes stop_codon:yes gene_type:complete
MIFMTHPQHGAMNVISQAESLAHQANGWVESTHEAWLGDKLKPVEAAPVAEQVEQAPKKPGRKPKA